MIKGVDSNYVSAILKKITEIKRNLVKEVTLDMASSMYKITSSCFPRAQQVIDKFHVQKLASEALQEMRINHRLEAIEQENKEIQLSKKIKKRFIPDILENGDTLKQLLARSRYLLFKQKINGDPNRIFGQKSFTNYIQI